jgi:GNAT superfamily N-acetyltransferase
MGVRGAKILQLLPDIPKWIYARWMILSGQARIYGDEEFETSSSIIQHPTNGLTCVIGQPDTDLLYKAITAADLDVQVMSFSDNDRFIGQQLPQWSRSPAYLHILDHEIPQADTAGCEIKFLGHNDIFDENHIPGELRREFLDALHHSPIAALFIAELPVSFCYAAAETESLWDISVDTLDGYRNRGYGFQTVSFMIKHMDRKGKQPVWGAEESNYASLRLAQKLGFKPVEKIYLYYKIKKQ